MKSVLFVYPCMMLGGSTTSLLSLLYSLNYDKYDVDLLLSFHRGEWMGEIPSRVGLLPPAYKYQSAKARLVHMLLSPKFLSHKMISILKGKLWKSGKQAQQWLEYKDVDFYRDVEKEYDVAIAFLEGQPCKYVAYHVKAKKKIAWIHVDYKESGFRPELDIDSLSQFDTIVTVSEQCKTNFCEVFPALSDRCRVIENILSKQRLTAMASRPCSLDVDPAGINLVTTCRISFSSKGLDRAVSALAKLKQEENFSKLHWYIIGDGSDRPKLAQMIADYDLGDTVTLLGMQQNPYPYLKKMSLFFLPSRWEGKPMAVTEGFIMGLPALVTQYASAPEQVRDGVDGMIVENSEQGVDRGLRAILEHPELIDKWRGNVETHDYSNVAVIAEIEKMLDDCVIERTENGNQPSVN